MKRPNQCDSARCGLAVNNKETGRSLISKDEVCDVFLCRLCFGHVLTMEFPDLGKRCSEKACRQLDFLPLKCDSCKQDFCKDQLHMLRIRVPLHSPR
ncbi:hypothetical protein JEQ12_012784 [Ovis aries]|uniref:AN1-type domain-containing protein n=1 Tax=Ovis aries TaxID=9940 RepID=A0A835ZKG8_SHEEP|nr:hypothetical protein JEQ12_012784 [Ovis aries]